MKRRIALSTTGPLGLGTVCLALLALAACGGRTETSSATTDAPTTTIPIECDQYLAGYRSCLIDEGRNAEAVDARIDQSRKSLAASGSSTTALAARCRSNLTQLHAACF